MIQTRYSHTEDVLGHFARGPVTVTELLDAIEASGPNPGSTLWDFRHVEFQVPLQVLTSPTYPPVREKLNAKWGPSRTAYVVASNLHKHMIELFAQEGKFEFEWRVFFSIAEAQRWLSGETAQMAPLACQARH